jgi:hypothetical protein
MKTWIEELRQRVDSGGRTRRATSGGSARCHLASGGACDGQHLVFAWGKEYKVGDESGGQTGCSYNQPSIRLFINLQVINHKEISLN